VPRLSKKTIAAVQKYGPSVDSIAAQYNISGAALLAKLIEGESNDNPDAVSSAGARGRAQFMPGSRETVLQRYGVDPWSRDPEQAVHAAALHLRGLVNGSKGLEGYNPGMPTYPQYILGQKVGNVAHYGTARPSTPRAARGGRGRRPAPRRRLRRRSRASTTVLCDASSSASSCSRAGSRTPVRSCRSLRSTDRRRTRPRRRRRPRAASAHQRGATLTLGLEAQASSKGGTVTFDGKRVARWIGEALNYARAQGWKGTVNSGYRSDAEQKRIYDSGVRPAAKPRAYGGGGSNHEFTAYPGGAVDVSDAQTLARILAGSPYGRKLKWAGAKDPVHFSHPHNGSY
jgi:hypothetical protein